MDVNTKAIFFLQPGGRSEGGGGEEWMINVRCRYFGAIFMKAKYGMPLLFSSSKCFSDYLLWHDVCACNTVGDRNTE